VATVKQAWNHVGAGQQYPIKSAVVVSEGDLVALDSNGQVVLADTDTGPVAAHGFAHFVDRMNSATRTGVAGLTEKCAIAMDGVIAGLSSLTIGGNIYLSATAGGYTGTAPTTNAHLRQVVGTAIAADTVQVSVRTNDVKFQTSGNSTVAYI
jgi:hypothetical protein